MDAPAAMQGEVYRAALDCVHCGLCLSDCPTYRITGREDCSPRGRVYLMRGVAEGRIEFGDAVTETLGQCLGCRACESACPSGVEYGVMLEGARAALVETGRRRGTAARLEAFALRHVVPHPARLRVAVALLAFAQRLGLDRLAAALLPGAAGRAQSLLPDVPPASLRVPLPRFTPAVGERRGRVALLEGCVMRELFGDVNRATVAVLAHNGFDVVVPAGQGCCGALHAHAGDRVSAHALAEANLRAFAPADDEPFDAVVSNSAGCGAALREAHHWLGEKARVLSDRARDVCEFLDEVGPRPPAHPIEARVCYDDPCHLVHAQGVAAAPRRLLEQLPGLELVLHRDASTCCGAAGTYNLTQPEMSAQVLERKLDALAEADPEVIATGNPGCLLQLKAGARQRGWSVSVVHPVELLCRAYGLTSD